MESEGSIREDVESQRQSISSALVTHADVTNYALKLLFAGVPQTIESWQTTGLLSTIINQHGQSIIPMDQRWVNVLIKPPESKDPAILGMNFGDRYSDPTDPSLGAILLHAHLSFHSFVHCSANQVEKNAWTEPVRSLISAVNDEQSGSTVTAIDKNTSGYVMRLLGLDLIPVRPDLLLGLNSEHIQVKESAEQGARQVTFNQLDLQKYIFSRSVSSPENDCGWEGWDVVIGNSDLIASPQWFSYLSIDLKGCLGTRAKVDIQDRISMRVSLGITIRLATQAASVDPETYRPADEVMRKTYGLTIVTDTWNLYVMLAEKAQIGEREGEEMTNETMSQKKERLCRDLKVKAYTTVHLEHGSLTNPRSLLHLISHLRRIRSESEHRHHMIGNWLYCLRE